METHWKKVNSLIYSQTAALQRLVCTSKSRFMPCFCRPLQLFATLKSNVIKASTQPENSPLIIFYRCLFCTEGRRGAGDCRQLYLFFCCRGHKQVQLNVHDFGCRRKLVVTRWNPCRHRNMWIYKVHTENCFFSQWQSNMFWVLISCQCTRLRCFQ